MLQPSLREVTERCVNQITTMLDDAGINYLSVSGRAKSVASFAAKAARQIDGTPVFRDPLHDITDQIGVRVITYLYPDVSAVAGLLADQATVLDDRDMGQETASEGRFGYSSRHLLLEMDAARAVRLPVQVQIRTVLQHAWAEFEHDIRYKGTIPEEHVPDLDRRFTLAAGLLELADREFSQIRDRLQAGMGGPAPRARPRGPADQRPGAGRLPGRAVRRRELVAHRPLRLDQRPAARARRHLAHRAGRGAAARSTVRRSTPGSATGTRPAPYAASTTRCSPCTASATSG